MGTIKNISRRGFVKVVGLASGGLVLACNTSIFSDKEEEEIKEEGKKKATTKTRYFSSGPGKVEITKNVWSCPVRSR